MILIDFNGIAVASFYATQHHTAEVNEDFLRHLILNTLRMYNSKYSKDYGAMTICCEGRSWRKDSYTEYKANRSTNRESSDLDWGEIFSVFSTVIEEIRRNIPFKVIQNWSAEADDIIGTLVEHTQEFGKHEKVMIVSNDKDFAQLHRYNNVQQFSPMKKKIYREKNPDLYLKEHIIKGDSGDGVPNIFSKDDVLVTEGARQTPVRKKRLDEIISNWDNLESVLNEEEYRNFQRNQKMVDLKFTPDEIKNDIINQYEKYVITPNNRVLPYLIKKKCRNLISNVGDFFPKY
jgi:5'-3' exonuclease